MRCILLIFVALTSAVSAGVLFQDDFDDGNADGWWEWKGGYAVNAQYEVIAGAYNLSNSGSGWIPAASHNGDQGGMMSTSDYSVRAMITPTNCYRSGLLARGTVSNFTGYLLVIIPSTNTFGISRLTTSGPVMITSMSMPLYFGETYWLHLKVEGTTISGKVWQGGEGDEPVDWMLTCTNSQYSGPGRMAVFCCNFSSKDKALLNVTFDEVTVFDLESSLEVGTWAGIKSAF